MIKGISYLDYSEAERLLTATIERAVEGDKRCAGNGKKIKNRDIAVRIL